MVDMCKVSYLLAKVVFLAAISSLKAISDMDDESQEPPFLTQGSMHHISTINPSSFEFRMVQDPRQVPAASAHGVMNTKHVESLFDSFPGFNRQPPRTQLSLSMAFPNKQSSKKRRPTIGQIVTKIIQLRGMTKAEDYPKIFRFTKSRISLDAFDRKKKLAHDVSHLERGDGLDPKNVPRSSLLIIPGGIYDRTKPLTTNSGRKLPSSDIFYRSHDNKEPYDNTEFSF